MTYSEAVDYISSVYWIEREKGLKRINSLLKLLGNPEKELSFIHVAGTNGKGSTCAMLESIFRNAGYTTGLFTSPHLCKYNERIKVNNCDISDDEFCEYAESIYHAASKMDELPTVFEKLTAMSILYFAKKKCNIVIMEVGMGGEFDSTNFIEAPLISVIASIGFDHMAQLGDTLSEIAKAKAGIIKESCPVVTVEQPAEVMQVLNCTASDNNSLLYVAKSITDKLVETTPFDNTIQLFKEEPPVSIKLPGTYQLVNISLVLEVIKVFNKICIKKKLVSIDDHSITCGLQTVFWPARFEILSKKPVFILDGAHNAHGIKAVTESLKKLYNSKKLIYIMGVMKDKNFPEMIDMICKNAKTVIAVKTGSDRALSADEIIELVGKNGIECLSFDEIPQAVQYAMRISRDDDVICCLGSLYLAGEVRKELVK